MAKRKVTLHDVSQLAQVSIATVSFVLNGTGNVSDATRQRVLAAVEELGYAPDIRARSLRSTRIQVLALLFPFSEESLVASRYFRDIIASVCGTASAMDYKVVVNLLSREKSLATQVREVFSSGLAGGMILVGPSPHEIETLLEMDVLEGHPVILLSATANDATLSYIDVDNLGAMFQAVEHFVRLGHTRIAYVTPVLTDSHAHQRLNGYIEAMQAHGLSDQTQICVVPIQLGDDAPLEHLLEGKPTAVIAFDDLRALQVHGFLLRKGFHIPEDVALIGFDNEEFGMHLSPRLSTFPQPFTEMGALAVQRLIQQIEDPSLPVYQYIFPMSILVRETCGSIPKESAL
jgi:DNA-binding LacI/PurR family transcriptional regulator